MFSEPGKRWKRAVSLVPCAAIFLASPAAAPPGRGPARDAWTPARPGYSWSFPEDHWAHRTFRNEWWYFAGHLHSLEEPRRRFGFQFTLFRIGLLPRRPLLDSAWASAGLLMGHAAVTDLSTGRHVFSELLFREVPFLGRFGRFPERLIAWSRGPAGSRGPWTLRWNGRGFELAMVDESKGIAFNLVTDPSKPLVLQAPGGYSRKARQGDAASEYYSFTRLQTSGRLTVDGREFQVRGESWMDREFGSNQLASGQVGWDWFGLQLDDGREVMLSLIRTASGAVDHASGTLVSAAGETIYLRDEEFRVVSTATWTSPATEATYPAGWRIELPGRRLILQVIPLLPDQENRSRLGRRLFYWEGAVSVRDASGSPAGHGYVELTGYGEGNRPPL